MSDLSRRGMLAVAFGPPTMSEALAQLPRICAQAECVELRLDLFEEPVDLPALIRACGDLTIVATLRPPEQGGKSPLPAAERLEVLRAAASLGAHYVDLEYEACSPAALEAVRRAGARAIASRHDFARMPADLAEGWWSALAATGADVVKVVGTAADLCDTLAVFRAFQRADRPTIAIAMGAAGLITRVLALREEHCLLTYAAVGGEQTSTAAGQLSVDDMRRVYRVERLQPRTRVFGLLGPHLERERLMEYNTWFASDGAEGVAVPFVASSGGARLVSGFRQLPVSGWHVHGADLQAEILASLDDLAPSAARQHTVNGIVRQRDGGLVGHWVESPREQYDLWRDSGE